MKATEDIYYVIRQVSQRVKKFLKPIELFYT